MIGMGMGRHLAAFTILLGMIVVLGAAQPAGAVGETPRTFNLYIRNYYEPGDAAILAQYDALGLDVDTPLATLNAIKSLNPAIKLLAYIPINGTYQSSPLLPAGSKWREMYEAAEANGWWLRNTQGGHIYDHAGKYTINISTVCPENASGQTMLDWYPEFIVNSVLQNGASPWDGVILDDVWVGIWFINTNTALNPLPIDADQNGLQDDQPTLDQRWKDGNELITQRIRTMMPAGEIVIGNGGNQFYHMNGAMIENFPFRGAPDAGHPLGYTWTDKMFGTLGYFNNETNYSPTPQRIDVVNAKWPSGSRYSADHTPDYGRHLRFCLASSMLGDGYFSIDFEEATAGHHSLWWEPEFDKPIGTPTGAPYQVTYGGTTLWRRDYTNGAVILNKNYTTFLGSTADGIPPIGWVDARVLLSNEMWAPETNPPGAVDDLTITRTWTNQIEIKWTNVGDDGEQGQAIDLQARYSAAPITEGNWASALIAPGTVIPELPGIMQTRLITGLAQNNLYYVAVKTRDLAGNWSPLSNVASATTVISDITAPTAVTNLTVLSTTSTGATVRWTATGDDGNSGTASVFDLRYATFPLNSSNFASGAQVIGEPTPGSPGTVHSMPLYGMTPFTTYYFAIKVGDEMPNWSNLSNVPSASTLAGDVTPPANISDLQVIAVGPTWVTLQWTAPGDDGSTGLATSYDLRFSPNPMTPQNFTSTNFVSNEPGPQSAGTVQTMTISGFGTDRTYWFGIRTADEFPNWSAPSNIVSTTTNQPLPGDTTPPAAIANLALGSWTQTSALVTWTSPGDDNA
ncbi:MAG: putative glycoside hydrolase, partial [Candidatus Eisenbacteria bacterium]|nr:putative glycoside hydrolase [Candidatus Eisenbacteria bacterium]